MKIVAILFALVGSLLSFVVALTYFFHGSFLGAVNYNGLDLGDAEKLTIIGIFVFILSIATLVISLWGFKHYSNRKIYTSLLIGGVILFFCASYFAGVLIVIGSLLGFASLRKK
jgi:hypothetical protein